MLQEFKLNFLSYRKDRSIIYIHTSWLSHGFWLEDPRGHEGFINHPLQLLHRHRLDELLSHAADPAPARELVALVTRESDNVWLHEAAVDEFYRSLILPDGLGCLIAIHHRHLAVHEDKDDFGMVALKLAFVSLNSDLSVRCCQHFDPTVNVQVFSLDGWHHLEHLLHNEDIHRVVIDNENGLLEGLSRLLYQWLLLPLSNCEHRSWWRYLNHRLL